MTTSNSEPVGRLLDIRAVVKTTSLSRSTIYRMVKRGTFPPSLRIGQARQAWPETAIENWKKSLTTEPCS